MSSNHILWATTLIMRAPRVRDAVAAWRLAIPTTLLTIAIGALTWPTHTGPTAERLLAVTLQLLAALILPHMVLDTWRHAGGAVQPLPPDDVTA